jgi:hypothetical protein
LIQESTTAINPDSLTHTEQGLATRFGNHFIQESPVAS